MIDQESELDRLYAAPPDQFVKLRNDLVQRLRNEGEPSEATRIGQLKKPPVSVWVVNQLARSSEIDIQRLIKAGEALEQAQRSALSGELGGFEAARREEAAAIRLLRTAAGKLLTSSSTATLDRITKTLRAAAATPEGRDLVKRGRLTEDLEPPGFEAFTGLGDSGPIKKPARSGSGAKEQLLGTLETLRERKRKATEDAKRKADEANDLEREAREAEALARKTTRAAAAARQRADKAADEVKRITAEVLDLEKKRG